MKKETVNLFLLFVILMVVGMLYKRYESKLNSIEEDENNKLIRDFLLDNISVSLVGSQKPILWIYVSNEQNARKWESFGSRNSFDVNQPYLYLTVKSIIKKCGNSFTICIIDNSAFVKLLPNWDINLERVPEPVRSNVTKLGLMKILFNYGGLLCPVSFLCMKNLNTLYYKGVSQNKMFLCETINENASSDYLNFYPNIMFAGSEKNNSVLSELIEFMERSISRDYTAESIFLGSYNSWCLTKIQENKINVVDGKLIGIKAITNEPIRIEDLMGTSYLKISDETYGILIPAKELLSRRKYEWFTRMSPEQIMESNIIIGNYLLLSAAPVNEQGILEPFKQKPDWIGFWKTPLYSGLYGLKPNYLGDNVLKVKYTGR